MNEYMVPFPIKPTPVQFDAAGKPIVVANPAFEVKDSGARQELAGGMVRDTEDAKVDFTLALDGPLFERYAAHLTKGAKKYSARNWMKSANGTPEAIKETYDRFRRSALRHLVQYLRGDLDEDHAAAVMFNLNGAEYLRPLSEMAK